MIREKTMSNGDAVSSVRAEYVFMLNVLQIAYEASEPAQKRMALLQAARKEIRDHEIPDEPRAKTAVTAEREAILGIISRALALPASADPLDHVLTTVRQRARDWAERNP